MRLTSVTISDIVVERLVETLLNALNVFVSKYELFFLTCAVRLYFFFGFVLFSLYT